MVPLGSLVLAAHKPLLHYHTLLHCSVAAGSARVCPVMESQPGAIINMVWTSDASGCMATASDDGSVCVWNTAVSADDQT